jgi:hypothetical protein
MQQLKLLFPEEASRYLRERGIPRSVRTLAKLRCLGGGPRFHKIGRNVAYSTDDLDAYAGRVISPPYAHTAECRATLARA